MDDPFTSAAPGGRRSVFVSYSRADRPQVQQLISALQADGLEVWWDGMIVGGEAFARTIETRLDAADAVIVAWSATAVTSDWVRDEAAHGRDRGRLVAVTLDGTHPPLGFRQYHAIDLTGWDGQGTAPAFQSLLKGVENAAGAVPGGRPEPVKVSAGPGSAPGPRSAWSRRTVLATGGAVAAAAAGGFAGWQFWPAAATSNSIAVLPFRNQNEGGQQDWFPDGLTDEIRVRLTSEAHLSVAAPTSSNLFRGATEDLRKVARKLGVGWLLEGTVRRSGNALRITASLVNGETGLSHWSQNYDRPAQDVFDIESEVAGAIAEAVAGQAGTDARKAVREIGGTTQVAAHDLYLQGLAIYNLDKDEDTYRQAAALTEQALALDPDYARAHMLQAKVAIVLRNTYARSAPAMAELSQRALAATRRALDLAPDLAEAYIVMGFALLGENLDYRLPGSLYERARRLAPGDAETARPYAVLLYRVGRNADAVAAITQARSLDRLNPVIYRVAGQIDLAGNRDQAAAANFRKALEFNPGMTLVHAALGDIQLRARNFAAAQEAYTLEPEPTIGLPGLAIAAHHLGQTQQAETLLRRLRDEFGDMVLYQQAQVLAQFGRIEPALAALDQAYRRKDSGLLALGIDFKLDGLRDQPQFRRLMAQMGLAPV